MTAKEKSFLLRWRDGEEVDLGELYYDDPRSDCCSAKIADEISEGFGRCRKCGEMSEVYNLSREDDREEDDKLARRVGKVNLILDIVGIIGLIVILMLWLLVT